MDSPGEKKGQRRGSCGHVMAAFDLHKKCARCRDKGIGDDPCVKDKQCSVCDSFSDEQKELFYCVNTSYLVDRCICPAPCRSRQTLEKNVLSWALAGTGSVLFIRQVAV